MDGATQPSNLNIANALTVVHDQMIAAGADVVTAPLLDGGPPDPRLVTLVCARARSRGGWSAVGGDPGPRLARS